MLSKKEFIENIKSFINKSSKILTINSASEANLIKLTLKILSKEVSTPLSIAFISTNEIGFNEVFSNSTVPPKTSVNYNLGQHKISFHIMSPELLKNPVTNVDYIIFYAIEDFKEKELLKYLLAKNNLSKNILVSRGSTIINKSILKLNPIQISFEIDKSTNYYNKMKSTINNYK